MSSKFPGVVLPRKGKVFQRLGLASEWALKLPGEAGGRGW